MKTVPLLVAFVVLLAGCLSSSNGGGVMNAENTLKVGSVFHDGGFIPSKFTCEGEDVNPPIYIGNISPQVKSLVIIMDDPDAPRGTFTHWIAWNIPPRGEIPENLPKEAEVKNPMALLQGRNDFGRVGYGGPCPPKGHGVHHYHFKVYALNIELNLKPGSTRAELEEAIRGHVIQWGEVVGLYERK